jgi:hypothetical protein
MCILDRLDVNTVPKETLVGNLPIGAEVTARVLSIDFASLRLQLSSKSSELSKSGFWEQEYCRQHDDWYHVLSDREVLEAEAQKRVRGALMYDYVHGSLQNSKLMRWLAC